MRLILIDGLPGSGKSTMAADLGRALGARIVTETEPDHPLHPVPTDAMGAAWADIHTRVSPEEFAMRSLERWSQFLPDDGLVVVESFPFQSAVRVLLQTNAGRSLINEYWSAWTTLVARSNPILIYLGVDDVDAHLSATTDHRGPEWTEYLIQAFGQMPYATSRGLTGWQAARVLLTDYAKLIDDLIATGSPPTVTLEGRPRDYAERLNAALRAC